MIRLIGVFFLSLLVSSCDIFCEEKVNKERTGFNQLSIKQMQWQENNIDSYTLTYERFCFCIDDVKEVTVTNGSISSIVIKDSNGEIIRQIPESEFQDYYTVTDLFDLIVEIDKTADKLMIEYDPILGYPTVIDVDPYAQRCDCRGCSGVVDDEYTYHISVSIIE